MDLVVWGYRWCWFYEVSEVLLRFGFSLDQLLIPQREPHKDPNVMLDLIKDTL